MKSLKDLVVVVAGACGGMGQAVCPQLLAQGARLALCDRDGDALTWMAAQLPGDVLARTVDVTEEASVDAFFSEVKAAYGGADILVNLAGISIPAEIKEMDLADYDTVMDVNVKGAFLLSKHFLALARPDGQIIQLGSMAALRANGNAPVYCTAKAAVNMMSQGLALQAAKQGIRVTTLNPGGADTPFWGERKVAREKLLKPEDIAYVILFVLQADARIAFHQINFESFLAMQ